MRDPITTTQCWLHESTPPALVWMFSTKKQIESHLLVHECVSHFDCHGLSSVLDKYFFVSIDFTPKQLGAPANRWRRCAMGALYSDVAVQGVSLLSVWSLAGCELDHARANNMRAELMNRFWSAFSRDQ
eukprot:1255294-Pyramimonas_sp.AAC.1